MRRCCPTVKIRMKILAYFERTGSFFIKKMCKISVGAKIRALPEQPKPLINVFCYKEKLYDRLRTRGKKIICGFLKNRIFFVLFQKPSQNWRKQNIDNANHHHNEAGNRPFLAPHLVGTGDACSVCPHTEKSTTCKRRA